MFYKLKTHIFGNRSVFGYSHDGLSERIGYCSAKEAIELLDDNDDEYDWRYPKWDGDTLIVHFEKKHLVHQYTDEIVLTPEDYAEFIFLKKWEHDNGYL